MGSAGSVSQAPPFVALLPDRPLRDQSPEDLRVISVPTTAPREQVLACHTFVQELRRATKDLLAEPPPIDEGGETHFPKTWEELFTIPNAAASLRVGLRSDVVRIEELLAVLAEKLGSWLGPDLVESKHDEDVESKLGDRTATATVTAPAVKRTKSWKMLRHAFSSFKLLDDTRDKSLPGQEWRKLGLEKILPHLKGVSDEDLSVVIFHLLLGNFTDDNTGQVRRYSDQEIEAVFKKDLNAVREHVTSYVKAVVGILRQPGRPEFLSKDEQSLLVKSIKALLGNKTWNIGGQAKDVVDYIRGAAKEVLAHIAKDGEERIFPPIKGLFTDIKVPPEGKHRLDDEGILPMEELRFFTEGIAFGDVKPHPQEVLVMLEYFAKLVDPEFRKIAEELANKTNGDWRPAPPKTCVRMEAKLKHDHKDEQEPKACANIDMSR